MSNHVHLEIQVAEIPLSRIMQSISQRYTQWYNWRHNKSGHVFQGRFKAVMVDADSYLLELAAYIHLNPVRAHVTDRPENYRWSSHRAYLGRENLPWLETGYILSQLSGKVGTARSAFARFVSERMADGHRAEFHGNKKIDSRIMGDDCFAAHAIAATDKMPERKPDVNAVVAAVKKIYGINDESLSSQGRIRLISEARGLAAWATLELSSGKLTELAPLVGRAPSTLTCAVQRIEQRRGKDSLIGEKMEQLRRFLSESNCQGLIII